MTDGKQVKNLANPTGIGKFLNESGQYEPPSSGGVVLTEVEIDFGSIPITSESFTIADSGIISTKKIVVFPSPNPATDRVGNDWEFDMPFLSGIAGTGNLTIFCTSIFPIVGKRKVYYQSI